MGQHRPHASLFRDHDGATDGILQESQADAATLILNRNGKPSEDDDGDGVLAHAFANSVGCIEGIDLTNRQAEVANDTVILGRDKCFRRATTLGLARVASQPIVQRRFSAVEAVEKVLGTQWLRSADAQDFFQGALRENSSRKPLFADSG